MFAEKVNEVLILGAGRKDFYRAKDKCIQYSCRNVFVCKMPCFEVPGLSSAALPAGARLVFKK